MARIGPLDPLEIGQRVIVGSKEGNVTKVDYVAAHPCGYIYVHTIRFTDRRVSKRLRSGMMTVELQSIKPITQRINYASIQTI